MEYTNYLSKLKTECKVTKSEWTDSLKKITNSSISYLSSYIRRIMAETWTQEFYSFAIKSNI